jgi:hypothetical protein
LTTALAAQAIRSALPTKGGALLATPTKLRRNFPPSHAHLLDLRAASYAHSVLKADPARPISISCPRKPSTLCGCSCRTSGTHCRLGAGPGFVTRRNSWNSTKVLTQLACKRSERLVDRASNLLEAIRLSLPSVSVERLVVPPPRGLILTYRPSACRSCNRP